LTVTTPPDAASLSRIAAIKSAIQSLSIDPTSHRPLLSPSSIRWYLSILQQPPIHAASSPYEKTDLDKYESGLQYLLLTKAATQIYGLLLNRLLDQTVTLADQITYWDEVLSKWHWTALYSAQMAPVRIYDWTNVVIQDVRKKKNRKMNVNIRQTGRDVGQSVSQSWKEFYGLVMEVVREKSLDSFIGGRVVRPIMRIRNDVREKREALVKSRLDVAGQLGMLLNKGLQDDHVGDQTASRDDATQKSLIRNNISMIDCIMHNLEIKSDKSNNTASEVHDAKDPILTAKKLQEMLTDGLNTQETRFVKIQSDHGKPSRITRYWLPVSVGILSSSTILRIIVNRQAEIITWIENLGATIIDFWSNWVVEPCKKIIKTIRHDEGSEVSIMSKRSLEGDRNSLERMVVEFAKDNPVNGTALTDLELADLRNKVKEGDLTPVLMAYEKDLAHPFMGTIKGNLIRTLLIQVQKTKVDVEVAMGGIDALLKSQELVFGFVGLTPGILVTFAMYRWLRTSFSDRSGNKKKIKQGIMIRQLRNIDKILSDCQSSNSNDKDMDYRDYGLLISEMHLLRQQGNKLMPSQVYREFVDDLNELIDVKSGYKRQKSVVKRIRWAYARWF